MITPEKHSCGTVRPHGWRELQHENEPGFFIAGMKSYGRAPTFLITTGNEQVRSIVAHLAGDDGAADEVQLVLPETGVCSSTNALSDEEIASGAVASGGCCGPAPAASTAVPIGVRQPIRLGFLTGVPNGREGDGPEATTPAPRRDLGLQPVGVRNSTADGGGCCG
jgi:hypothetical protein